MSAASKNSPAPELPRHVLWSGRDVEPVQRIDLAAGAMHLVFEPELAMARHVRAGGVEMLRGVYAAVRDKDWNTVLPVVSNLQLQRHADSFELSFDATCRRGEIDFVWHGRLEGSADGRVTFSFDGVSRSDFRRNRIGFCVLHGGELAGRACEIEHTDGSVEQSRWPYSILPHQPFKDIRAVRHNPAGDMTFEVRAEGDTFEMEDQRNWTDASFKTYCTPLELPMPVRVRKGDGVRQQVTLKLSGQAPRVEAASPEDADQVRVNVMSQTRRPLPQIGLCATQPIEPLSPRQIVRLASLGLSHLRVDLHLGRRDWPQVLAAVAGQAKAIGARIEAAVLVGESARSELAALAAEIGRTSPPVARWLVFREGAAVTPPEALELARVALGSWAPVGGGSQANFAELNRNRLGQSIVDLLVYPACPQVHTFDNASMVENLAGLNATVESARNFAPHTPIAISPITLRKRSGDKTHPGELPAGVDPRQMSLFGAAWTLGSIKSLTHSDAVSVTWFETLGPLGVMERAAGSPQPEVFRSVGDSVFPMWHVFADVGEFREGVSLQAESARPLEVEALVLSHNDRLRTLLCNFTHLRRRVVLRTFSQRVRVRMLDEATAVSAMVDPEAFRASAGETLVCARRDWPDECGNAQPGYELKIELPPYAIARLDSDGELYL